LKTWCQDKRSYLHMKAIPIPAKRCKDQDDILKDIQLLSEGIEQCALRVHSSLRGLWGRGTRGHSSLRICTSPCYFWVFVIFCYLFHLFVYAIEL